MPRTDDEQQCQTGLRFLTMTLVLEVSCDACQKVIDNRQEPEASQPIDLLKMAKMLPQRGTMCVDRETTRTEPCQIPLLLCSANVACCACFAAMPIINLIDGGNKRISQGPKLAIMVARTHLLRLKNYCLDPKLSQMISVGCSWNLKRPQSPAHAQCCRRILHDVQNVQMRY